MKLFKKRKKPQEAPEETIGDVISSMSNKFEDILEELDRRYENGEVSEEKYRELRERVERVKREADSLTNPDGQRK